MKRRLARRIARAIFELDQASWSVGNNASHKRTIEQTRLTLMNLLTSLGYEFARLNSAAIKQSKTT